MLLLEQLNLFQFRNYHEFELQVNERIVCICGSNGSGKTNLLDAIYYLCFTKSYFSKPDAVSVSYNKEGMRINGIFQHNQNQHHIKLVLRENNKKEFVYNNNAYKKFSEHIGKFSCVFIAPDDVELISGNSSERRKLIDTVLSQINYEYLEVLIDYNKILLQRNSLLKSFAVSNVINEALLQTYDNQLAESGNKIFQWRKEFMAPFLTGVKENYNNITGHSENLNMQYFTQLEGEDFLVLLRQSRNKDFILQRTNVGIHKDDIEFLFNDKSFKTVASQGQRKSLLFAIKLAEWNIIAKYKSYRAILLLDDVFEKLDENRMHNLLKLVCVELNCQVFITDTHCKRLSNAMENLNLKFQLIKLN